MEHLLHYVWKHKLFPLKILQTTKGLLVEIIDSGLQNPDAGPDFFNAKLKIDGTLWVGNIEIHTHSSDWYRHGHDHDKAYDSVILHVVAEADAEVTRSNGEQIPQLLLTCPENVQTHYHELCIADQYPACYSIISSLSKLTIHSWLTALQTERLEQKARQIAERLERCDRHWEDAFFITLARNFGFGLNGDAFETWAGLLPFRAIDKHRNDLFQIEAFFFGQAGLLEEAFLKKEQEDEYSLRLRKEFRYLQRKFDLAAHKKLSQKEFMVSLVENAVSAWEAGAEADGSPIVEVLPELTEEEKRRRSFDPLSGEYTYPSRAELSQAETAMGDGDAALHSNDAQK